MRIAVVTQWPYPHVGGVSTHIGLLVGSLEAAGHTVTVVAGPLPDFSRGLISGWEALERQLAQLVLAKAPDADVFLAHDVMAAAAVRGAFSWAHVPLLLTVHGYWADESVAVGMCKRGDPTHSYILGVERRGYLAADAVITVDQRLHDYVAAFRSDDITVLENAVDTDALSPISEDGKAALRQQFGFGQRPAVVCARRLTPKNGVRYAIEALAQIPERARPDLVIAGDGEERRMLQQLALESGVGDHVRFLGAVSNHTVHDLYRAADLAVVPSVPVEGVEEASSIAALEAMGLGTPLVACSVGGLKRIGEQGGALLVPPKDGAALAETMLRLLRSEEDRQAQGRRGREAAVKHYSVRSWLGTYLSLVGRVTEQWPQREGWLLAMGETVPWEERVAIGILLGRAGHRLAASLLAECYNQHPDRLPLEGLLILAGAAANEGDTDAAGALYFQAYQRQPSVLTARALLVFAEKFEADKLPVLGKIVQQQLGSVPELTGLLDLGR